MSLLRDYQSWATLGLINDAQGQQDVLDILHSIGADFPDQLNLRSAPNCDRLRRAIARQIRDMPEKILCLHRDDAVGALYGLFKLYRSDWSATGSTRSEGVSCGMSCGSRGDGGDDGSDRLFVEGELGDRGGPFEGLSISQGDVLAIATSSLSTQVSDSGENCHQGDCMNVATDEQSHRIARDKHVSWRRRREKYGWDQFDYQHTHVIFNAFVDITWLRYPGCRETIRLSDIMGRLARYSDDTTPVTRTRHQHRSPDGDWIHFDSISLFRLRKQLQVIRSFNQDTDVIWWSPDPLNVTSMESTEAQARIDNQRDLTWAIYRSFDAPWQDWRGRRLAPTLPSQENHPRFSIIVRNTGDLVDTLESMDLDCVANSSESSVSESISIHGNGESGERLCGDDLADILSAIINEPLQPNDWVSGPF